MIIGKVMIIVALIGLLIIASFLFCLAIFGANGTDDDLLLNDKEQEDYLIVLSEARKLKHKEINRRKNEKSN